MFRVPVKRFGQCYPTPGNVLIDMGNTYSHVHKSVINQVTKIGVLVNLFRIHVIMSLHILMLQL